MCSHLMNRALPMRRTVTPELPERWAFVWPPPVQGLRTWLQGIATAQMDSVPMVAITANVGKPLLGKDSFQEVDIAGIVMPITKHSYIVKDITKLADTLRKAFYIAKSGRPGVVLVDVTKDVTGGIYEYMPSRPATVNRETSAIRREDLETAVRMIEESEKPFIFNGGGAVISNASREIMELATRIQAPVCDSLMGKGAFPGDHPYYTGMLGMHGTKTSNLGVSQCDLLIVLGALQRPCDRKCQHLCQECQNSSD